MLSLEKVRTSEERMTGGAGGMAAPNYRTSNTKAPPSCRFAPLFASLLAALLIVQTLKIIRVKWLLRLKLLVSLPL